jgi:hypothetical protein
VPQWPLSSLPRPTLLLFLERNSVQTKNPPCALSGEKGQNDEKGRYTNKRCAGWIIQEKRPPRNVNSHCGEPSPTPSLCLPIGDRNMYRVDLWKPSGFQDFRTTMMEQTQSVQENHHRVSRYWISDFPWKSIIRYYNASCKNLTLLKTQLRNNHDSEIKVKRERKPFAFRY